MTNLNALFSKPRTVNIGGVDFELSKLAFEDFPHALAIGEWMGEAPLSTVQDAFAICLPECPACEPLLKVIAGCLRVPGHEPRLTADDVRQMPIVMVAEAALTVVEDNIDFFMDRLPGLVKTLGRLTLTGSKLPSSLSALATTSPGSGGTASAS